MKQNFATQGLDIDVKSLCLELLVAEDENEVIDLLNKAGFPLEDESSWLPLGQNEGNFSQIGNQQEDGAAALVEKIVNSIDAVLISKCHEMKIDPEGPLAPSTMQEAVEKFLGVKEGRLGILSGKEQGDLAEKYIHFLATGTKSKPCYMVVDRGEGQSPQNFEHTFLSTTKSSPKVRIPFVQGKFNAGGTGSLQFCGEHNIQLIISKRNPLCPASKDKELNDCWGFTVIRRKRPTGLNERSSVFKYLAPQGNICAFKADSLPLLPGKAENKKVAYQQPLLSGTCVKLYNYKWSARSTATLEARRAFEKYFQVPCLPFRIHETRDYNANYMSTTVVGVWNSLAEDGASKKNHEDGFPAQLEINPPGIGKLPVSILVWKEDIDVKHYPTGVYFLVNGQVHGELGKEFISRQLPLSYIKDHILVAVDCTNMTRSVAEDFFLASRDRLRKDEAYQIIRSKLKEELDSHTGLRELNAEWRRRRKENALNNKDDLTKVFNQMLKKDPGLAKALNLGGLIPAGTGPGVPVPYEGREFPSYYRLAKAPKDGLVKTCPINATVKIELETDARNDYFTRAANRGALAVFPSYDLLEGNKLWNGRQIMKVRVPFDANVGDKFEFEFQISDVTTLLPFSIKFTIVAGEKVDEGKKGGGKSNPPEPDNTDNPKNNLPQYDIPKPIEVKKEDWVKFGFDSKFGERESIKIHASENTYDFFINVDNKYLLNEMNQKNNDPEKLRTWFVWGLTICAMGAILSEAEKMNGGDSAEAIEPDVDNIARLCDGIGRVIIPVIRSMSNLEIAQLE
ncbi:MAG: hypothetical protein V4628_08310 [Pseudomonadota bacterium]